MNKLFFDVRLFINNKLNATFKLIIYFITKVEFNKLCTNSLENILVPPHYIIMIQWPILNYSRGLGKGGCPPDCIDLMLFAPLLNLSIRFCCSIQHSWYVDRHCRVLTNTFDLHVTSFPFKTAFHRKFVKSSPQ